MFFTFMMRLNVYLQMQFNNAVVLVAFFVNSTSNVINDKLTIKYYLRSNPNATYITWKRAVWETSWQTHTFKPSGDSGVIVALFEVANLEHSRWVPLTWNAVLCSHSFLCFSKRSYAFWSGNCIRYFMFFTFIIREWMHDLNIHTILFIRIKILCYEYFF